MSQRMRIGYGRVKTHEQNPDTSTPGTERRRLRAQLVDHASGKLDDLADDDPAVDGHAG